MVYVCSGNCFGRYGSVCRVMLLRMYLCIYYYIDTKEICKGENIKNLCRTDHKTDI